PRPSWPPASSRTSGSTCSPSSRSATDRAGRPSAGGEPIRTPVFALRPVPWRAGNAPESTTPAGRGAVAQPVEDQRGEPARLGRIVAADLGHAGHAHEKVGGRHVRAQHALGDTRLEKLA